LATQSVIVDDGTGLDVEQVGEGHPLIALHGLGGDRSQPLRLLTGLPARLVAPDLRGHGVVHRIPADDEYTFERLEHDLRCLLSALGLDDPLNIVGFSMGAGVALRYAITHPTHIHRLVLVRPAWTCTVCPENLKIFPLISGLLRTSGSADPYVRLAASGEYRAIARVSPAVAASLAGQLDQPRARTLAARLDRMPRSVPYQNPKELGGVSAPTLVLAVEDDPVHPTSVARDLTGGLPDATMATIPNTNDLVGYRSGLIAAVSTFLGER